MSRQDAKNARYDPKRDALSVACEQVGVTLRTVREAQPSEHRFDKASGVDIPLHGRRVGSAKVETADLDRMAHSNGPRFSYISADEPLAQPGNERRFYAADKPGVGLEAVARFLLDSQPMIRANEELKAQRGAEAATRANGRPL